MFSLSLTGRGKNIILLNQRKGLRNDRKVFLVCFLIHQKTHVNFSQSYCHIYKGWVRVAFETLFVKELILFL